jgi:AraC-like DNA-binding protein
MISKKKYRIKMKFKSLSKESIIAIVLVISLEISLFAIFWKSPVIFFPNENISFESFSDKSDNEGNSSLESNLVNGQLKVDYTLREGYEWPFAGIRMRPKKSLDLSEYDDVIMTINVKKEQHAIASFWSDSVIINGDTTGEQPHFYGIKFTPSQKTYKIPFSSFSTPAWWLVERDIELNNLPSNSMKQVTAIDIRSGYAQLAGLESSFTIEQIKLLKKNRSLYLIMLTLLIGAILDLWLRKRWKEGLKKRLVVPLKDLKINTMSISHIDRVISVIGEECVDSELTVFKVGQQCKISELDVSKSIKNRFKLSFKQYLNTVRMEVATTLLRESDLTVKDIALRAGYKTNSHFFRVFSSFYNESPTEYRKNNKKDQN